MAILDRIAQTQSRAAARFGGTIDFGDVSSIPALISPTHEQREVDDEFDLLPRSIEVVAERSAFTSGIPALAKVIAVTHADHGLATVNYSVQSLQSAHGMIVLHCERSKK
jgi:hypothetical protein